MYRVVTTMNAAGWKETGERMVQSFLRNWPNDVGLTLYAEGFDLPYHERIEVRQLPDWLDEFKKRHKGNRRANGQTPSRYDFRFDAVKFAHKVAALTDAALRQSEGVLIWLDADTFTHSAVLPQWLEALFPDPSYIAWLDRENCYPECGFIMFRCGHPAHRKLMMKFRDTYTSDNVLGFRETHDSFVLEQIIKWAVADKSIEAPVSLSGDKRWHHPFVNGPLGACLDHMKGDRKRKGRSNNWDMRKPRSEPYWRGVA